MRHIAYSKIIEAVKELCIKSAYELPADVLSALTAAAKKESNAMAAKILQQLVENARLASLFSNKVLIYNPAKPLMI